MTIASTAARLIDIDSVSGNEGAVAAHLAGKLAKLGMAVERDEVAPGRPNLLASFGEPRVLLCTHLDTVPPFFPARLEDGVLHGRGACDTKGAIAAMLEAARRLVAEDRRGWGILLVVGEETDSIGAQRANDTWGGRGVEAIVVGEPTGNRFAVAEKGAYRVRLDCQGKSGHSAYPETGESAIHKLVDVLAAVRARQWGTHEVLGDATVNVGAIGGGLAANIIADRAWAAVGFRVVTSCDEVARELAAITGDRAAVSVECRHDPAFMKSIAGYPTTVVAFGTDVPFLTRFGDPYLCGPGTILDAHTAHEKVTEAELADAADLYADAVQRLLDGAGGAR